MRLGSMWRLGAFAPAAACASAAPESRPAAPVVVESPTADPGATPEPPARSTERCVVRGDGDGTMRGDLTIYAAEDTATPLVVLGSYGGVGAAIWELGRATAATDEKRMARIRIGGQRLARVSGYANIQVSELQFRRDVVIVPKHATIDARAEPSKIRGEEGEHLVVSQSTGFPSPAELEVRVLCRDVRWGEAPKPSPADPIRSEWTMHHVSGNGLALLDAPRGKLVFEMALQPRTSVEHHAARDGFVEISFGYPVHFRGWVDERQLSMPAHRVGVARSPTSRTRAPRVRGREHLVPVATVTEDTPLWVGTEEPKQAGMIERGAIVRPGEKRGEIVTFTFDNGALSPPSGQKFFVQSSALGEHRKEDRRIGWVAPELPRLDEEREP